MSLTTRALQAVQVKSKFNLTSHQALRIIRAKETATLALENYPDSGLSFEGMLLAIYRIRQAVFLSVLNALHEETKKTGWSRLMRLTPEIKVKSNLFQGIQLRNEEAQQTGKSEEDIPRIEVDEPRLCSEMKSLFPSSLANLAKLDALKEMGKHIEESQVPSFSLGDEKNLTLKQVIELAKAKLTQNETQLGLSSVFSIPDIRDHACQEIGPRALVMNDRSLIAWFNSDIVETLLNCEGIVRNECMTFGVNFFLLSEMGLMNEQYETGRRERILGKLWTQRNIALSQVLSSEGITDPCTPDERIEQTIEDLHRLLLRARNRFELEINTRAPEFLVTEAFEKVRIRSFLLYVVCKYQNWLLKTLENMQKE